MKLFKNEKEKTTEERIRKARRDTHQAIYIALASIGIKIVLFSREYGQYPVCDAIIVLNLSRSSFL